MIERLQKNYDNMIDIIYEHERPLVHFKNLTEEDPQFRSYFSEFAMAGVQIFRLHKKLRQDFAELKDYKKEKMKNDQVQRASAPVKSQEVLKISDESIPQLIRKIDASIEDFADMSKDDAKFKEYCLELQDAKKKFLEIQKRLHSEFASSSGQNNC